MRKKTTSKRRNKHNNKPIPKRILKVIAALAVFFGVFLVFYAVTVISNAPKINTDNIYSYLSESSIIYDDEGKAIDNVFVDGGNRVNVEYKDIPQNLVNAVVSIEDKTFWKHNGFNVLRIFGAIKDSIFSGENISGTSTITQQLARNVYLSETKSVRSLNRKVSEAWYTLILERNLSKEEIAEAYLNTIYFGYNSYGAEAASQAYFSKNVSDLNLIECASLAAIPKSPDSYALVRTIDNSTIADDAIKLKQQDVLSTNNDYTIVYNGDVSKERRNTTLKYMNQQGYISDAQMNTALNTSLKSEIDLGSSSIGGFSAYFSDFVVDEAIKALVEEGYSKDNAKKLIYTGGLKIYTSLNTKAQQSMEKAFANNYNFPDINLNSANYDGNGNILDTAGNIILYKYSNYIDDNKLFTLNADEYSIDNNNNMTLYKDKRLNFYETTVDNKTDYSVEFNDMYIQEDGVVYSIDGGTILIPQKYKSKDNNGNLVISASFFEDYPSFFTKSGDGYTINEKSYSLKQKVRQPQAAMVIIDNETGAVKAMMGGRSTTGQMLYNRAVNPRQPGSSIKPLSIYSSALQQGADAAQAGIPMTFQEYDKNQKTSGYGKYWTAASIINDAPLTINGQIWPKNAYSGYMGEETMRTSVEQSINVNAVRVFQQIGANYAVDQLEKFGISTLVTEGDTSDMNASALALGGMTKGITPLELASAYMTFPNEGTHIDYSAFTKIKNRNGETLVKTTSKETKVIDPGVAFIMSDILRTTVTKGIAGPAQTSQVTAGKTGTTSDQMDIWFSGFTPQYSAAVWIGNDVNIELTAGSDVAAALWSTVMNQATAGMNGSLPSQPNNVINKNGEYFVKGTEVGVVAKSKNKKEETKEVEVETCSTSGYIASPWCTDRKTVTMKESDSHSKYYCPVHNQNPTKYPVAPGEKVDVVKEDEEDNNEEVTEPTPEE